MIKILSSSGYPGLELASIYSLHLRPPIKCFALQSSEPMTAEESQLRLLRLPLLSPISSSACRLAAKVRTIKMTNLNHTFSHFKLVLPPCGQGRNYQEFSKRTQLKAYLFSFQVKPDTKYLIMVKSHSKKKVITTILYSMRDV